MDMQKKYKQTWNRRSQKYVLIDCSEGIKGGFTGEMQAEPFEGVPIVNDKPKIENGAEHKNEKKKTLPEWAEREIFGADESTETKEETSPEPNTSDSKPDGDNSREDAGWLW